MARGVLRSTLDTGEDAIAERFLVVLNEEKIERSHRVYVIPLTIKTISTYQKMLSWGDLKFFIKILLI